MHNPLQVIYDINATGNPFDPSIYELPLPPPPAPTAAPFTNFDAPLNPGLNPPTFLNRFAAFFQQRSTNPPPPIDPNDVFGDSMTIPIPRHTTRLYFINVNGLNLQKNSAKFRDLCEEMHRSDVHLFAAAEINLDTQKFAVRQALQDTARKTFPHHCIQTSSSTIPADKFYKPGGTMIMAQGDLVGRSPSEVAI
jgi:hypothetical protein